MARDSIKLDKPLLSKERWFSAAYECQLWIEEGADDDWPEWLVKQTRRLGYRKVNSWLSDEDLPFGDYQAGLALAEHCCMV